MNFPENLKYARTDEWVRIEGDEALIGISDYAQHELGDIVYVELPEAGTRVTAGAAFGVVESVKAVSDLVSPVSGEVLESNTPVTDEPGIINNAPYGDGWLIKVRVESVSEDLMDSSTYSALRSS
jgi:glycine cleavage system H protein